MAPNNKSSSHALAALLVVVVAAVLGQAPRAVEAQGGLSNITAANVMISGIVPCTAGTNINPATVVAFPNATTQLVCGNTVVTTVKTSSTGAFVITLGTLQNLIANTTQIATALLSNQCGVTVTTPQTGCNVTQAGVAGTLTAPVQFLNSTAGCVVGAVTNQTGTGGLLMGVPGLFTLLP